jgi:site-specific DNA recombinase
MRKSKTHTTQRQDAVKYGRVSSKEQEKEGFSIPAQFKLLDQYAKSQGLKVVREFVDVETARSQGGRALRKWSSFSNAHPCACYWLKKRIAFIATLKIT